MFHSGSTYLTPYLLFALSRGFFTTSPVDGSVPRVAAEPAESSPGSQPGRRKARSCRRRPASQSGAEAAERDQRPRAQGLCLRGRAGLGHLYVPRVVLLVWRLPLRLHSPQVYCVQWSGDSSRIASAGQVGLGSPREFRPRHSFSLIASPLASPPSLSPSLILSSAFRTPSLSRHYLPIVSGRDRPREQATIS